MIDLSISFITNCVFAYLFSYHFSLQVAYGYYVPLTLTILFTVFYLLPYFYEILQSMLACECQHSTVDLINRELIGCVNKPKDR